MFDWDRLTENDPVATAEIPISQISAAGNEEESVDSGETNSDGAIDAAIDVAASLPALKASGAGFLPTFGPTFVNFYGAPREFQYIDSDLEHLNLGNIVIFVRYGIYLNLGQFINQRFGTSQFRSMYKSVL